MPCSICRLQGGLVLRSSGTSDMAVTSVDYFVLIEVKFFFFNITSHTHRFLSWAWYLMTLSFPLYMLKLARKESEMIQANLHGFWFLRDFVQSATELGSGQHQQEPTFLSVQFLAWPSTGQLYYRLQMLPVWPLGMCHWVLMWCKVFGNFNTEPELKHLIWMCQSLSS